MKKYSLLSLALVMFFLSAAVFPLAPAAALPDPDAPYDLTVTMNTTTGIILVDWKCNSAIYQTATVMRKENSASAWEEVDTVHETSYEDDALQLYPGKTYDYQIKNDAGFSTVVSVVRSEITLTPPVNVQGERIDKDTILVNWTNTNTYQSSPMLHTPVTA